MQVILLSKISNLGNFGDQVKVKPGYARNFLIPYGKAISATKKNIEFFKIRRAELEIELSRSLDIAKDRAEKINMLNKITITSKAGAEGKLFGSIGARDIVAAVNLAGIEITKNEVRLKKGAIRTVGEHEVNFHIHSGIFAKLIVNIIPE